VIFIVLHLLERMILQKITHGGIEMGAHPKPARLTAPVVEGICIIFEKSAYST
jgi:hypothetical protein